MHNRRTFLYHFAAFDDGVTEKGSRAGFWTSP